jgi:hypothetical protein
LGIGWENRAGYLHCCLCHVPAGSVITSEGSGAGERGWTQEQVAFRSIFVHAASLFLIDALLDCRLWASCSAKAPANTTGWGPFLCVSEQQMDKTKEEIIQLFVAVGFDMDGYMRPLTIGKRYATADHWSAVTMPLLPAGCSRPLGRFVAM